MSMLEENFIRWQETARQEGRQEGLLTLRRVLLAQMTERFGPLSGEVRVRVEQITSIQRLQQLTRRVLSAGSLKAMGLGPPRRPGSARKAPSAAKA